MGELIGELADKSFTELLALQANTDKPALILSIMDAFKKGEAGAIKLVTQALLETQYSDQDKFPINDERFKQIIQMASEAIGAGDL